MEVRVNIALAANLKELTWRLIKLILQSYSRGHSWCWL